ncbi:MAG: hypothetical protein Q4B54_03895 [Coriobacteriales bacterium]|nr:hypothetical protein [Coriobacteriales bacterium]
MAEQQQPKEKQKNQTAGFFRKQATDRLSSPDDLDQYLRVTSPSVWLVLLAIMLLLVGLLVWGLFGTAATSISTNSVRIGEKTFCYVSAEQVGNVHVGDYVRVNNEDTFVKSIAQTPLSPAEVHAIVGNDYLVETIMPGNWGYEVEFVDVDSLPVGVPMQTMLTTEHIPPISLVFGSGA